MSVSRRHAVPYLVNAHPVFVERSISKAIHAKKNAVHSIGVILTYSWPFVNTFFQKWGELQLLSYCSPCFSCFFFARINVDLLIPVISSTSLYVLLSSISTACAMCLRLNLFGRPSLYPGFFRALERAGCVRATICDNSSSALAKSKVRIKCPVGVFSNNPKDRKWISTPLFISSLAVRNPSAVSRLNRV